MQWTTPDGDGLCTYDLDAQTVTRTDVDGVTLEERPFTDAEKVWGADVLAAQARTDTAVKARADLAAAIPALALSKDPLTVVVLNLARLATLEGA